MVLLTAVALCATLRQSGSTQSTLRRITNTSQEGVNLNPSLSGDGRVVAFESTEDIAGAGGSESFRAFRANVSVDPATIVQLGATRAPAPALSQDASRIAFASKDDPLGTNADGNSEIFLHDGARLIQITNTTPSDVSVRTIEGNFEPSISDDGRFIAFSSNRSFGAENTDGNFEIYVYDTIAQGFAQLTNSSGVVGATVAKLSGNGANVAYIYDGNVAAGSSRRLLLTPRNGFSPPRVLSPEVEGLALSIGRAISDDGQRVVWSAPTAPNSSQVFLFDGRNGNTVRQITNLGTRVSDVPLNPTISGDGSRIAFATRRTVNGTGSNSDGSVELYTFDIPSATLGRVTNLNNSGATAEVVSSLNDDGTLIAFNFPRLLSGPVSLDIFENNSEMYLSATPPRPTAGTLTVLNGASFGHEPAATKAVAPNSIAVARGSVLAFTTQQASKQADGTFPTTLAGTSVTVNGRSAQIFFVSPAQVNFLMPAATELGSAEVVVSNSEGFPSRGTVPMQRAAPGVFTFPGDGTGEGVILKEDTLTVGPFDPTDGNVHLIIFCTGVRNASQISLSAGGRTFAFDYVIGSTGMPGMDELHARLPADLRGAGTVDLAMRADGRDSNPVSITFAGDSGRDLVINEFLADPADGLAGDANGDGVRSASDDEFVELVNTTVNDIDLTDYRLLVRNSSTNADTVRHVFAAGSVMPACTAIVIFGGGNPNHSNAVFGGAQVTTASSGGLSLINSSGAIILNDPTGAAVNFVSYGGASGLNADANQSLTRSPDATGGFVTHQTASNGERLFSPGTKVTGSAFGSCAATINRVEVSPTSASEVVAAQRQFTARAFDAANNEISGVIFSWQSSNPAIATIDQHGLATTVSPGSTEIRASGRGVFSAPAILTVTPPPPVLTSVTIAPATAAIGAGETQQFTAQAKDQTGQDIGGVAISFASSDTSVATIDLVSAASVTGSATATVAGHATGTTEIRATVTDGSVSITSVPASLSVEAGAGQLLISEFRTRGPLGAADEFVEIYNPSAAPVKIGGLKIRASNSGGTIGDRVTITAGLMLPPGCHYLIANGGAGGYSGSVPADQTYGTGIADDGGIAITGSNGTRIIDAVGMSATSAFKEGAALAPLTLSADQSYERKPGGAYGNGSDANNNATDFSLTVPGNPQNLATRCLDTSTADLSIANADAPDPVTIGANITYTLSLRNNGVAAAAGVVVTDNLPSNVSFVSCDTSGAGVCGGSGNNRTITFASVASGSTANVTLVVTANGPVGTGVSNSASIISATPDANPSNNAATSETIVQAPVPTLSVGDVTETEGDSGATTFSFTVNLSAGAPGPVKFDIATGDLSATASGDYVASSLTNQVIPTGQQTFTFDVTVNGDTLVENDETFLVHVTNVLGAIPIDSDALGTIQNDDTARLVIGQLYGGGGNSGATYTHDFIEIFNRGSTTVNLGGWSLQYMSATGTGTWSVTPLSGILLPGQYYLVAESSVGAIGSPLPAPDATGSIAMAATAGKIALLNNVVALAGSCPASNNIIDLVGYGATAICFEGPAPAPAPSASNADMRAAKGCTDTNNNALDFSTATPAPRNTAASLHDCNAVPPPDLSISDLTLTEGNSGTTTFMLNVTLSAPAPPAGVTFDIVTADNTATVADNDYVFRSLTNQTLAAGQQTYSLNVTVNGDVKVEPDETFFVNVTNVSGANVVAGHAIATIQNDDAAPPPNISLNDVAITEGNGGSSTLTFTVSLSSLASAGGVTFDIATQDNTATTANSDYMTRSLTSQTIPAGQQTYVFDVIINGDKLLEGNEVFFVNLANVVNATVSDGQAAGAINNDDGIVISQIYGGGGNAGSTLRSDFIELFNRSTTTIDISTWSVQYIAATSTTGSYAVTNFCSSTAAGICTLAPGQYFLVKLGGGSGGATDLPAADSAGTTDMSATAGKVAVVINRTALSGTACQASAATVADHVGYGTTANCFEGAGRAATPSATNATFRKATGASGPTGCQDTDNNATDFVAGIAAPRNKVSPISACP
jgi:uncharacterized protein (TIGR03437 family)